ncbi:hypothetical protein PAT3040_03969, partial [Paenibacillus agaridevorans]
IITLPDDPSIVSLRVESFFEQGTGTAWFDDTSLIPWVPLEKIAFEQEAYTVPVGGSVATNVDLTPANTSEKELIWTTSDPTVATVANGVVTGANTGVAIVTAASSNGKKRASVPVYVGLIGEGITAEDDQAESIQGGTASGTIKAYSETGQPLFYAIGLNVAHGLLDVEDTGKWSYFPYDNFYGTDRFIVTIRDDQGNYAVSQVAITVHPANHSPIATDLTYTTDKNKPITGLGYVALRDPDGDQLVIDLANQPLHGQVALQANGDWSYTPDNDYVGNDWFALRGSDGHGGEAVAKVYLYMAPRAEELISELITNQPNHNHPRILATVDDFDRIQSLLDNDIRVQQWFAKVKQTADTALGQEPAPYQKPDGLRLNMTAPSNIAYLAFVFRVTGEQQYLDRAWLELQNVSTDNYPDWGPEHFLDTATITQGVALGYDWLYDYLSSEQLDIVRHAIVEKGLKQALPLYAGMTYWTKNNNNWNFVCNAGIIMGALAVADEEEEIAGAILQGAFKSLQHGLRQYAPDGSAIEGPAYWSYGTDYLVYLLSSLETAFGHDFGFSAADGIPATPDYPLYITGPQGPFNYSDGPESFIPGRLLLWFAEHHQEPGYAWYHQFVQSQAVRTTPYDILWYRPELYNGSEPPKKDYYFSRQQAVTMRSSWSDSNALFVGFKGGMNGAPHGDLDIGSFVLDANGVRWASDLGSEDYNLPGFWEMGVEGRRWTYYRKRTEGHNSIVINPSAMPEQKVTAVSKIVKFEDNREQGAYAIADMTEAYKDSVVSAQRGVALLDGRRQFLVQDEIQAKLPSELYWFMHTEAQINIEPDGKTAILSSGGQRLQVQLLAPAEAVFSVMDAVPLSTSPNPEGQTVNTAMKKLTIHLQNRKNTTISVRMVPLLPGQDLLSDTPDVVPLDQWSVAEGTIAYSTTAPTNHNVVAALLTNEPVTITNNGGSPTYIFENNGSFTFEFMDVAGNRGSAVATVSNIDKVAPTLSISVDKTILTPPNHKLVPVQVTVNADDAGGSGVASIILASITSNENDNESGDGNTTEDIQEAEFGTSDTSFLLRAERSGNGTGRIYTITYTITDYAGNTNSATATVTVPKGGK